MGTEQTITPSESEVEGADPAAHVLVTAADIERTNAAIASLRELELVARRVSVAIDDLHRKLAAISTHQPRARSIA